MTLIGSLLIAVIVASQATLPQAPPPAARYTLGPQDQVKITVLEDPEVLNNTYTVDAEGFIQLPYLNRVPAAGLTVVELQDRIRKLLKEGAFIRDASVHAELTQAKSQSVIVSGEVRVPGEIPMSGTMTLLKALALAGSPLASASSELTIAHRPKPGSLASDKDPEPVRVNWKDMQMGKTSDVQLLDGDLVHVPKAQMFYMSGQVRNTGPLIWEPSLTVEQAIVLAGGLTDRGSDRRITATRIVNGKPRDIKMKLADKILPNDVVKVGGKIF